MANEYISTKSLIKGGSILLLALGWNTAFKNSFDLLYPSGKNSIVGQFIYAALLTIFVLLVIAIFNIFNDRELYVRSIKSKIFNESSKSKHE